jgi:hypothetical protein
LLTYWLMYFIPAGMALFVGQKKQTRILPWILVGILYTLLIGFRFEVGGDWFNYIRHYENTINLSLKDAMQNFDDPGHRFLNWLSAKWDMGVYGTNVVYGAVFMYGLVKFSREQTYPWLVMVSAVPYLVTVVAMGYSRQGVAIGLFLLAMTYLDRGKFMTYVVLILVAALFHKTAILLLPLGVFLYGKGVILRILMIVPIAYGAWDLLLAEKQEHLWHSYVEEQMQSQGAKIRVAMNLLPSLLLLKYRKEWKKAYNDYRFWFWIAIGSIASMFLVNAASTAVDRTALYFIPIQLVVFSRLPHLARKHIKPSVTKVLIVLWYAMVLFVWLAFATHSKYWVPYQNFLLQGIL